MNISQKLIFDQLTEATVATTKEGIIEAWNFKAEEMFGIRSGEAVGKNIYGLIFSEEQKFRENIIIEKMNSNIKDTYYSERVQNAQNEFVTLFITLKSLFNEKGVLQGYLRTFSNLTYSKHQNWINSVMEHISSGVSISDMNQPDNPLIYVNKAFEDMTGYTSDEVLGKNCRFLQGLKTQQPALKRLREAIRLKDSCTVTLENFKKDGTPFINQFSISVVYDSQGEPTHFVGIQKDITEKIQNEIELSKQKEIAVTSSKMAVVGEMAGGICHEINNPLMILRTHIDDIKDQVEEMKLESPRISNSLDQMDQTINRIAKIVKSLREFSHKNEHQKLQKSSVQSLIDDAVTISQDKIKRANAQLVLEVENYEIPMKRLEIAQVLINFISNSCDAIESSQDKRIIIKTQYTEEHCFITVSDFGTGIEEAIKVSIFTPFYTTKDVDKGTGLGLSISKKIVQSHGGTIEITSLKNPTTFQVRLKR